MEDLNTLPNKESEINLEDNKNHLRLRADKIAEKYQLGESEHYYSQMVPELNKFVLAMLDDYVTKSGYEFPDQKELTAIDFGSGHFWYYEGYKKFFEKYQKSAVGEKRQIGIMQWDSDPEIGMAGAESIIRDIYIDVSKDNREKTRDYLTKALEEREGKKFNIVTMFAMGPGLFPIDPEIVNSSFKESISQLSAFMAINGILIVTTSFGGAKKQAVLSSIQEAGLKVLLNEHNEYEELLLDAKSGFTHEDIIIAIKEK